ncbi:MAG TPA: hypothetical protein VIG52_06265 [Methyloceanibacter sp.]|jgi:hypothetical protein
MVSSSNQKRDEVYAEIVSPLETFTWNVDATVTARRRRRTTTLRLFALGSFLSVIALVGVLHHARIIAFGPMASAANVQGEQPR